MSEPGYVVESEVWLHPGPGGWHFVTLPADVTDEIRVRFGGAARAFGSLAARVRIGDTEWETSLFPDTKRDAYLVPVKAAVRRREGLADGDQVVVFLKVTAPA